jgi:hypothetical protein
MCAVLAAPSSMDPPLSQPRQVSIPDAPATSSHAVEASLLASPTFNAHIAQVVERAVASSLANTLEQSIEVLLIRVLSRFGLQQVYAPVSPQQPPLLQDAAYRQQLSAPFPQQPYDLPKPPDAPLLDLHQHPLQHNQLQQAQQDSSLQQPSDAPQQQQLIGYERASYPQLPYLQLPLISNHFIMRLSSRS